MESSVGFLERYGKEIAGEVKSLNQPRIRACSTTGAVRGSFLALLHP